MNRRGQVFLLLTILSITFIFAVSTVLLEIQRSQYLEPSPDLDETFEAWDNAVHSIEQILNVQIAINTQAGVPGPGPVDNSIEIRNELTNLENYLFSRGLIVSIDLNGTAEYLPPITGGLVAFASMTASFLIQIESSSGNSITQALFFSIQYDATIVNGAIDFLYVSKIVNGKQTYMDAISLSGTGTIINDFQNGSWSLTSGIWDIVTSDGIELQVAF